jgi:hypothetical protein
MISGAVATLGFAAGLSLAGFTTGGAAIAHGNDSLRWAIGEPVSSSAAASPGGAITASEVAAVGPEHYECRGCGPGLAERRILDDYATGGTTDLAADYGADDGSDHGFGHGDAGDGDVRDGGGEPLPVRRAVAAISLPSVGLPSVNTPAVPH